MHIHSFLKNPPLNVFTLLIKHKPLFIKDIYCSGPLACFFNMDAAFLSCQINITLTATMLHIIFFTGISRIFLVTLSSMFSKLEYISLYKLTTGSRFTQDDNLSFKFLLVMLPIHVMHPVVCQSCNFISLLSVYHKHTVITYIIQ